MCFIHSNYDWNLKQIVYNQVTPILLITLQNSFIFALEVLVRQTTFTLPSLINGITHFLSDSQISYSIAVFI